MKNNVTMKIAFVIFLLSMAAEAGGMNITAGVTAVASIGYIAMAIKEEKKDVYSFRRKRTDSGIRESKGTYEGPDLGVYHTAEGRKHG